ncbi:hypothetical protein PROCOU_13228 [Listeria rocourtiae FSL F6-920]|nr:hypothetical protein PROCOU_13228 [Listeria rocourtiae FSL F6-920]
MGVDIGTTSTTAVIFNVKGEVVAWESRGYPLTISAHISSERF